jgi:hypothetical protein
MENIIYKGEEGVFYTNEEFATLQDKIIEQNELISELRREVGL